MKTKVEGLISSVAILLLCIWAFAVVLLWLPLVDLVHYLKGTRRLKALPDDCPYHRHHKDHL